MRPNQLEFPRSFIIVCHFEARTLVATFDVEPFVGFGAVEDSLFKGFCQDVGIITDQMENHIIQ